MSDTIQCACRGRSRAFLLDPVGEENGFIIKRMQQRAVRNHFIKKTADSRAGNKRVRICMDTGN